MILSPQCGVYAEYTHGKSFDLWANWEINIHTCIHDCVKSTREHWLSAKVYDIHEYSQHIIKKNTCLVHTEHALSEYCTTGSGPRIAVAADCCRHSGCTAHASVHTLIKPSHGAAMNMKFRYIYMHNSKAVVVQELKHSLATAAS